jgi:probable HAF family extracellular repeat protein
MKASRLFRLLCLLLLTAAATIGAAQTYTMTDLGVLPGASWSAGDGINASGEVVGASGPDGASNAFVYSNGTLTNLGTLGGHTGVGNGINASGQAAGYATNTRTYRAFISNGDTLTDIGDLGGGSAVAYGINDAGQVVGSSVTSTGANHPFLYSNGRMIDLGTLGSPDNVNWWNSAQGVNNSGVVAGTSYDAQGNFFGFVWSNGKMTKIGTLGGSWSQAWAINNNGQVTGNAYTKTGASHAFLRSASGKLQDLGVVGGTSGTSWGFGVNDTGVVVGQSTFQSTYHAFVYIGGKMKDLNKLVSHASGWVLIDAHGINNAGQIACTGMRSDGSQHAFLLTPR